jgi:hypothetical protein
MPILTLQQSMRRLGRIRMGAKGSKTVTKNGKKVEVEFPRKIESWRMTSASRDLLEAAAAIYGGEVGEWEGSPNGTQWELFTEADAIDVVIPPGEMAFSQWFEMWSGGGCQRRCDGTSEQLSDSACMCPADPEDRIAAAQKGEACKPTTRLFVIQPHLPDVGLWHFESHGFYAATEIPGTINIIRAAAANGTLIPARLRIEQRTSKANNETLRYAVPVIELPTLTPHALMTGEVVGGQLPSGTPAQLSAARAELEAGGTAPKPDTRSGMQRVSDAVNDQIRASTEAALAKAKQPPPASERPTVTAQLDAALAKEQRGDTPARPLPSAGSGDGANMRRAILTKAQRIGMDGDGLDAVCRGRVGKEFAQITTTDDANEVLAALDGKQGVLV